MEDDDIKLNPVKKTVKAKIIIENDNTIPYFELLKKIKNKELDPNTFFIIDSNGKSWTWSADIMGYEYIEKEGMFHDDYKSYLTDDYNELDLVDLKVTMIPIEKKENTPKYIATQKVIDMLEQLYMDLNMEIDNCQGCMSGLDEAFEELNIYKELVKFLGGNIDGHIQELTDNWFKKAKEHRENEEREQARRNEIIKPIPFPILDLMGVNENVRNILWKQNDKINEICKIIIEDKSENNL